MPNLFSKKVMDHYKNPRNRGELKNPTVSIDAVNPVCGDCTTVQLNINDSDVISDAKFESLGCAISVASASILTEHVKNKKISEVKKLTDKDLVKMMEAELTPAKVACATMSVEALQRALKSYEKKKDK